MELLLLLGGGRAAAQRLWLRKECMVAQARLRAAAGPVRASQRAAQQDAGGRSEAQAAPTDAQVARKRRSERRLREKHLARKAWAAVRLWRHLCRWCRRARASLAARDAAAAAAAAAWEEPTSPPGAARGSPPTCVAGAGAAAAGAAAAVAAEEAAAADATAARMELEESVAAAGERARARLQEDSEAGARALKRGGSSVGSGGADASSRSRLAGRPTAKQLRGGVSRAEAQAAAREARRCGRGSAPTEEAWRRGCRP